MSVKSSIFNEFYYSNICFGSDEFKKNKGLKLNPKVKNMIDNLSILPQMDILEIGCGRGEVSLYMAKKAKSVIGIDYSKDAIKIANNIKSLAKKTWGKKVTFYKMSSNKLKFKNNSFDLIVLIDTLDHLNKQEVDKTFTEILRVLKPNGSIFIKTCANRIILDKTYKYYILPMNRILTGIDKKIKNIEYEPLPVNPRTKEAKKQHVNESDYFYLKSLVNKYNLKGKIWGEVGFLTAEKSVKSKIYNFLITLNPLSKFFPLNIIFSHSFFAYLKRKEIN